MLRARGRLARAVAMTACLALLVLGGLKGDDDHFPFGPMRMYSRTIEPSGVVPKVIFEGVTETGETMLVRTASFGMRPAEVEGQMDRLRRNPALLRHMVTAYDQMNQDKPRLVELRLIIGTSRLRERRTVSYHEVIVARWSRS